MQTKPRCFLAWSQALLLCTKSVRTLVVAYPSAQAHSGLSAHVTVRSSTALVKKRADQHRAEWIALVSPLQAALSPLIRAQSLLAQQLV
jgi:hypothetical protein